MLFISLFLCQVWRYVFSVVSCRSNFVLDYQFTLFFFLYASILITVTYARGFLLNSRVSMQVYCIQSRMLLFWDLFGRLSVVGWFFIIVESSWVLLVSIYSLCFSPETPFDLFSIRFCSCHSFFPFCFGISALGLFYLSALLGCCLWVVVGFESCRVCYYFLYLIYFKKHKNIFCFSIIMHPCIFSLAWYLHYVFIIGL